MKTYKKEAVIIVILILLFILIYFVVTTITNDKNKIISLQNDKIKLLENKKKNNENVNDNANLVDKIKDNSKSNNGNIIDSNLEDQNIGDDDLEDNSGLLGDGEGNYGADLNISQMYDKATKYYNNKEYKKAIDLFKTILELEPESVDVAENLYSCYINIEDYENAIKVLKGILNLYPDRFKYYGYIGEIYKDNNQLDKYNLYLFISSLLEGKDFSGQKGLFKKYYDLESDKLKEFIKNKQYGELRDYVFKKYPDEDIKEEKDINDISNSENWSELYDLAVKKADEGKMEEAIDLYKKSLTILSKTDLKYNLPILSGAWNNLGFSYRKTKQEKSEIICFMVAKALGAKFDQTINANEKQKQIINLEQETINEFVNNKEYDDLRKYIFNKYLGEKNEEYNIEDNN